MPKTYILHHYSNEICKLGGKGGNRVSFTFFTKISFDL